MPVQIEDALLIAAGGSTGRALASRAADFFSPLDRGAVGDGVADDLTALNSAAVAVPAGGALWFPPGRTFGISAPFILPNNVGLIGNGAVLKALSGFAGECVLQLGVGTGTGAGTTRYYSAQGVQNIAIDCNEQVYNSVGVEGIRVQNAMETSLVQPLVYRARGHGIRHISGYQLKILNAEVHGSSPRDVYPGTALPDGAGTSGTTGARGILLESSDNIVIGGAVQRFKIGVDNDGGNNRIIGTHVWGTYHSNDTPMLFGFLMNGEGGVYIACTADSPVTYLNNGTPNDTNGGVGFCAPMGSNGVDSRVIGCQVIVSNFGTATAADTHSIPQNGSLLAVYSVKARLYVPDFKVQDSNGAGAPKLDSTSWIKSDSSTTFRTFTIGSGGNLKMKQNLYVRDSNVSVTPGLTIGGNASPVGIAYRANATQARRTRIGSVTNFYVSIELTAKGTTTGALTISVSGLGVTGPAYGSEAIDWMFPVMIRNAVGITTPVIARLRQGSSTLVLEDQVTGTALTDANLTDTTRMLISGSFMWGFDNS